MAFTRHLIGDLEGAIEYYHQALSRKPDDPFSSEMLNRALVESLDNMGPLVNVDEGNESFGSHVQPKTPGNQSSMSMDSLTMSSIKAQKTNRSMMTYARSERSFFSPGESDIDMSMT